MVRQMLNAEDYRQRALRLLPRGLFEYIDRGTEDENALRRIRSTLDDITLSPAVLTGHGQRDMSVEMWGRKRETPLVIAPTALAGLVAHDGETKLARVASRFGIPFCVSTQSVNTIETIRKGAPEAELWFQLYVWRDRALTDALLERVRACGCDVLVITADTQMSPNREYNQRNGFSIPLRPTPRNVLDILSHPRWLVGVMARYLASEGIPTYGHYPPQYRTAVTRKTIEEAVRLEGALDWDDVARFRDAWPGKIVVKGVLSIADAQKAIAVGADGIVVSAHGGRNLDCLPTTAECLAPIADHVAGKIAVMADTGIRRGTDILKYNALGAGMVLLGRLPLWGLAAGGEAGAEAAMRMILTEMDTAMGFLGAGAVSAMPDHLLGRNTRG